VLFRKRKGKWGTLPEKQRGRPRIPPGEGVEIGKVAEIEWKGIIWKAAYGDQPVKELLTILKGFGPMEILAFEKPGLFRGELSLSLTKKGTKEITLYHLDVLGPKRRGEGRKALKLLRKIFGGELYVEDPGIIRVKNANQESIQFWAQMYREGLIDALESDLCSLHPHLSDAEFAAALQRIAAND
jgi:hypothetical protein